MDGVGEINLEGEVRIFCENFCLQGGLSKSLDFRETQRWIKTRDSFGFCAADIEVNVLKIALDLIYKEMD